MKRINGLTFLEYLKDNIMLLDGATGTYMQRNGMGPGICPEQFALAHPELLLELQREYIAAGSKAVFTFTFGANPLKLNEFSLREETQRINTELAAITIEAAGDRAFVGGELGPSGAFIKPLGELDFSEAVDLYKQQIKALEQAGVDFITIETMIDIQETRAAVIAAKECCSLPVIASMTFERGGRTLTGTSPAAAALTLISAGADVVGLNCSTGPAEMVPVIKAMKEVSSVPLMVKPNAGMPRIVGGETVFDLSVGEYRKYARPLCEAGANLIGGCCGTDPEYIRAVAEEIKGLKPLNWLDSMPSAVASPSEEVYIGSAFRVIGERINPTGKPKLKEALKSGDYYEALDMALEQKKGGAHILDVNVGLPGTDEAESMENVIEAIAVQSKLPLCIDSSKPEVIERALRSYPGRALVNSVSAKSAHLSAMMPLLKRYKPMFILLPIGDEGIPQTAQGRIEEIKKTYDILSAEGIDKQSILVDGLVMSISSDSKAAVETLKVVRWCTDNGFGTVLGISNGSFGLPERRVINSAYLVMAVANGLNAAIMNPGDELLMDMYHASEALSGRDENLTAYIKRFADTAAFEQEARDLAEAILTGKKKPIIGMIDGEISKGATPDSIINNMIIPALQKVGDLYEQKVYFLPQLIYSAEAAREAFDHLENTYMTKEVDKNKKKIVIATVKGDIHDIGKNLVAMLLRNHGYAVTDLGKDVDSSLIVDTAEKLDAEIIALSALLTTTAGEMEKVIKLARERSIRAKIMVGGAVVSQEFADAIGADGYSADAAGAVRTAARLTE